MVYETKKTKTKQNMLIRLEYNSQTENMQAIWRESNDEIAVKVIDLSNEDVVLDELAEEVACLKLCSHKNIVKFFGCFKDDDDTLFVKKKKKKGECFFFETQLSLLNKLSFQIAMELLKKAADELYMDTNQPLKEPPIKLIIKGLVHALDYLHSFPIMHRDIKGMFNAR